MRRFKEAHQGAIKNFSGRWIKETAQCQEIRLRIERWTGDQRAEDFQRVGTAQSDYADRASPGRSTKSNYRISLNIHVDLSNATGTLGDSLAGSGLQTESQAARIAFADRFGCEIMFLGQRQMYDAPFTGIHGTKYEGRRRCANLARRMLGHGAEFGFPRCSVVIGVANDPLAFR